MKIVNEKFVRKCQQCGSTTTLIFNPEHINWPDNNPKLIQCYSKNNIIHINRGSNVEYLYILTLWNNKFSNKCLIYGSDL